MIVTLTCFKTFKIYIVDLDRRFFFLNYFQQNIIFLLLLIFLYPNVVNYMICLQNWLHIVEHINLKTVFCYDIFRLEMKRESITLRIIYFLIFIVDIMFFIIKIDYWLTIYNIFKNNSFLFILKNCSQTNLFFKHKIHAIFKEK